MTEEVQVASFHSGPLPFITISDSGECRVEEYAAKLLSQLKGKLAVISVAGMRQTGKSYLLNRLMGTQAGFAVGGTRGIWIWGQPVELGEDYYAILMDTEGLTGKKNDAPILTLAILLSSYLIMNTIGPLDGATLQQLAAITDVAKSLNASADLSLLWVLRDLGRQPIDCLETALAGKNAICESIKTLFPRRDCLVLARPSDPVGQIDKVPFNSLSLVFQNQVEKFVEKVYTSVEPKTGVNGPMFVQLATQYCSILSSGGSLALAWDNVVQLQLKSSLREAVSTYRSILNDEGMKKLPLSDSQVKLVHLKAKALAKATFPTALLRNASTTIGASVPMESDQLNQSISIADVGSPELFLREFKFRRQQLLDHLKSENRKLALAELEVAFAGGTNGLARIASMSGKYPLEAYCAFLTKAVLSTQMVSRQNPLGSNRVIPVGPADNSLLTSLTASIASVKDLLVSGLTEMKSAELDVRSAQVRTENEQKLVELERKFNKQLGEARRKNEMLISDLKVNYEAEVGELKLKKTQLEEDVLVARSEIERMKLVLSEQTLRTNFGNVINQQSELILQFLKSGAKLNGSQTNGLDALTTQYRQVAKYGQ